MTRSGTNRRNPLLPPNISRRKPVAADSLPVRTIGGAVCVRV